MATTIQLRGRALRRDAINSIPRVASDGPRKQQGLSSPRARTFIPSVTIYSSRPQSTQPSITWAMMFRMTETFTVVRPFL